MHQIQLIEWFFAYFKKNLGAPVYSSNESLPIMESKLISNNQIKIYNFTILL